MSFLGFGLFALTLAFFDLNSKVSDIVEIVPMAVKSQQYSSDLIMDV